VPYRANPLAVADLLGGQISLVFADISTTLPQIRAGKVKGLGVSSLQRSALAPDLPTMIELGLPDFEMIGWFAAFVPAKTPRPVIDKLNAAAVKTLADPGVRQKLEAQGFEIPPPEQQTPAALAAYQKAEIEKWWPVVKAAGIKPE